MSVSFVEKSDHRDIPSGLTIMAGFAFNEDQSNIPRASELEKTLPVSKPYWLNDSEPIDQKGKYN